MSESSCPIFVCFHPGLRPPEAWWQHLSRRTRDQHHCSPGRSRSFGVFCDAPKNPRSRVCCQAWRVGDSLGYPNELPIWVGTVVMYQAICMTLVQCQGVFIKFCIFLYELGALGLLFLILNPTTTWVIHLNVAER